MAGLSISVKYDDRQIVRALEKLQRAGGNMHDAFSGIGEHLEESTKARFEQGVDPDGNPWKPLSETTKGRKKKNADKVLLEYGGLMDSLHYNADSSSLEFGTNLVYGAMHQFGGTTSPSSAFPNKDIPARPFLGINADDEAEVVNIIEDHIRRALK